MGAHRQPELAPEGYQKAGPAPLTPEYKAVHDHNLELRAKGILAGDPPATACRRECRGS